MGGARPGRVHSQHKSAVSYRLLTMKITDVPTYELRRMLTETERTVGSNTTEVRILQRERSTGGRKAIPSPNLVSTEGLKMNDKRLEPLLLSPRQVGELIGCSRSRIFEMLASSQLPPSFKIGGARRFHRGDIEKWIAFNCPSLDRFMQLTQQRGRRLA